MHRFYLPPEQCQPPTLTLTGAEAHHARDVLRIGRDEPVTVLDGAGRSFLCKVQTQDKHRIVLTIMETAVVPAPPAKVTLVQAIPRGKILESIIQKAVELGVARVIPLLSGRVATRLDAAAANDKALKLRQVAIEAIKQCGQAWLPEVDEPITLPALLQRQYKFDLALVGSLQGDGRHPRRWFDEFAARHNRPPETVCAWIGPEGDFTGEELDLIRASGACPITLGPLVLRSETAAIYSLSIIAYELQARSI